MDEQDFPRIIQTVSPLSPIVRHTYPVLYIFEVILWDSGANLIKGVYMSEYGWAVVFQVYILEGCQ